ncbi:Protein PTCD3 homolog, mitochondrial [Strongyloides ratti]|uniref:Small ribosomal subunit protein mS39 n=1 Tax=Strongyloides ratti TaxID=34506 RepID=A0A090LH37_STRRB|nr:Protein PTCD3 homolog, mitochondrial [Strongyloides ratti]CEF67448.1 Protein PTCD3 homolog, mitochondrial [Strongyloides ratti]
MLRKFLIQGYRFTTSPTPKISIPYAIKRSPTELLEALNSTVGTDKTAPHYSFIDDPLCIPSTDDQKNSYFVARELGKRTARILAKEWPTLFMYDIDEPRLPIFRPKNSPDIKMLEGTETELIELIEAQKVKIAVECYEKIRANGIDISEKVQMDLFKLVVYCNENDLFDDEAEDLPCLRKTKSEILPKEWVQQGIAELLFETTEKTPETYSIMIAGLCRYSSDYSLKKAHQLYNEMLNKKMVPYIEVFNALMSTSGKDYIKYLKKINELKIQPNTETMNSCILCARNGKYNDRFDFIQKLILEFKQFNVEPNFGTYRLILKYLTPGNHEKTPEIDSIFVSVLDQILKRLENASEIKYENVNDAQFFITALTIAVDKNNEDLVKRVEKIYTDRKNKVKFISFVDETYFYKHYLHYNMIKLPLDEFEKIYKEHVPRVCGVNQIMSKFLVSRLLLEPKWSFIKRIIEDSIVSNKIAYLDVARNVRKLLLTVDEDKLSPSDLINFRKLLLRCLDIWADFIKFNEETNQIKAGACDGQFVEETKKMFSKYID